MDILVCMPKGLVTESFFSVQNVRLLETIGNITWANTSEDYSIDDYKAHIKDKDILIIGFGSPFLNSDILNEANNLKLVLHLGGSVAPYLCDDVFKRNIKVLYGNEVMAQSVAEGVISYILAFNRDIATYSTNLKENGLWKPKITTTRSLIGKTIGIVSYGSISKYLIEMLQGFNVNILLYTKSNETTISDKLNFKIVSLEELFSTSDIITIQSPLNSTTENMIDSTLLNLMKPSSILVNTAKAGIVKEDDLIQCLQENKFSAILDVFNIEPIPEDNPYRYLNNVLMMPHMAGPTSECRLLITKTLINEINNILNGGTCIHEVKMEKFASMTKSL